MYLVGLAQGPRTPHIRRLSMMTMEFSLMTCHLSYAFPGAWLQAALCLWTVPLLLIEVNRAMQQQKQTLMVMMAWIWLQSIRIERHRSREC
mmetsp:Transcript_141155/g.450884  ORF Transcript_141155/g.450884 Transcript_141155/m.450884 type:complete len:91 (+) Transcript_141155:296-568(+)